MRRVHFVAVRMRGLWTVRCGRGVGIAIDLQRACELAGFFN